MLNSISKIGLVGFSTGIISRYPKPLANKWKAIYKSIADNVDLTFTDRRNGSLYIKNAMSSIISLNKGDSIGRQASVELLPKVNDFYRWIIKYYDIDEARTSLVFYVNDFTERHNGDLTTFVNSISWDGDCVPSHWVDESEKCHFDVSGWNTCS